MAAEQQLERSVLERKEREELRAIAQAMSLDTNSRSKKADIIDQILRAAGVEVTGGKLQRRRHGAGPTSVASQPRRARAANVDVELTRRLTTAPSNGDGADHEPRQRQRRRPRATRSVRHPPADGRRVRRDRRFR